ncbi:MAG: phosphoribosylanthranilate isomerase [Candidatus Dadabacteria bacterium]|nr:phosphoribosylanthranilate isomerase [Candidatus Dadabacteria bacterium]
MVRIKVCGITSLEDALAAVDSGADALGFVFYEGSKRYIPPAEARRITDALPPFAATVGVFVNASPEEISAVVTESGIGVVQLHGDETPELASRIPFPVIKAVRVADRIDPGEVELYPVQAILFDKRSDDMYGGTGKSFDWSILRGLDIGRKVILSGGLTADNVAEAIGVARPYAVDVSSGVEDSPGRKNHLKLRQFIQAVRNGG